ncbi:2Fe-2S iron-sulfur cluster-binding protein [Thioalkalivibrio thiocyanodenitrificans]|uniref:2Fe-2S iron-sulfur cluster-binding protein n=1 Tax=Thioalkalivibrio thiocyanodenitrificans TaxID=243063 RepID=UPI00035F5A3A|nr:2Fe-2S iron-sulfur cluster-binding protein [Thioalkalivibrio thiocyanodenitrificans]
MDQWLSVIRAAKFAGVTRGELQARIKSGDLPSFDGMVKVEDLLGLYPATRLEDERTLERLDRIKDAALGKDIARRSLPEPEVLARRLAALGHRYTRVQQQAEHYAGVLEALEHHLREVERTCGESERPVVRDIKLRMQSMLRQKRTDEGQTGALAEGVSWLSVMAPQVRLVPSNHEFLVEGADTILQAALRAGLSIRYGCSDGNCGQCRARIVSGEVREVQPHGYALTDAEKAQGLALMCAVSPVTDLVVEMDVARTPAQIPRQSMQAEVRSIEDPAPHVRVLRVRTPGTHRLRFLGGQYVRLSFDDGRVQGAAALANCPCDDRNLVFHLAENRDDPLTTRCFEGLSRGDPVGVEGPFGGFVMGDEIDRPLVFLACDTGFAPIKSLIEHVIALDVADRMDLIWVASGSAGHYEDNLCRSWDDALDDFHYRPMRVGVAGDPAAWPTAVARSLAHLDDPGMRDYYIAGPSHFIRVATDVLTGLGVPEEHRRVQAIPPSD